MSENNKRWGDSQSYLFLITLTAIITIILRWGLDLITFAYIVVILFGWWFSMRSPRYTRPSKDK